METVGWAESSWAESDWAGQWAEPASRSASELTSQLFHLLIGPR